MFLFMSFKKKSDVGGMYWLRDKEWSSCNPRPICFNSAWQPTETISFPFIKASKMGAQLLNLGPEKDNHLLTASFIPNVRTLLPWDHIKGDWCTCIFAVFPPHLISGLWYSAKNIHIYWANKGTDSWLCHARRGRPERSRGTEERGDKGAELWVKRSLWNWILQRLLPQQVPLGWEVNHRDPSQVLTLTILRKIKPALFRVACCVAVNKQNGDGAIILTSSTKNLRPAVGGIFLRWGLKACTQAV